MGRWAISISDRLPAAAVAVLLAVLVCAGFAAEETRPGDAPGRPATDADIAGWNIDVTPDGAGLPPGRGSVEQGRRLYAAKCARCHGATGTEGPYDVLVGGRGTLATSAPLKTVGSYWPYATTLFDYLRRAMPFDAPQSLAPDELYALVAWLLHANGIIPDDAVMDAATLPAVQMPNRQGFVPDPRPDVPLP